MLIFNFGENGRLKNIEVARKDASAGYSIPDAALAGVFDHPHGNDRDNDGEPGLSPQEPVDGHGSGMEVEREDNGLIRVKAVDLVVVNYENNHSNHSNDHGIAGLKQKKFRIHTNLSKDAVKMVVDSGQTIRTDEILFMHGSGEICCIHTLTGNFRIKTGLHEMMENLAFRNMLMVKESCAVNIARICAFDEAALYLDNSGETISITYAENIDPKNKLLSEYDEFNSILPELMMNMDPSIRAWFFNAEKVIQRLLVDNLLSVRSVAEEIGISERQMQRLFKKHLGISPVGYIAEIRLAYARKLMKEHPGHPMQKIASRAGFHDVRYFRKVYREHYGTDPVSA